VSAPPAALSAPAGLTGRAAASHTITLSWTDTSTGEGGFYVERAVNPRKPVWKRVGQVGPNATTFTQKVLPWTYLYRVQAFNPAQTAVSSYSNQVSVTAR